MLWIQEIESYAEKSLLRQITENNLDNKNRIDFFDF